MRKATKQELEDFIRVNDFGVDGIYDKDSAIKHFRNASKQFKSELNQYKQAYQHCVDDLIVLRANNKRLERENRFLLTRKDNLFGTWRDENKRSVALSKRLEQLEQENEKQLDLLQDFSKFINYKLEVSPASGTYKHYRSKLDQLGVK